MTGNQRTGNLLSEYKLRLVADPLEGAVQFNGRSRQPQLSLSVYDNQPRFTVYTNVEGDKQDGRIEGNMDTYTFGAVMQAIREVARTDTKGLVFQNKGHFFSKEKGRSEHPGVKSSTIIGRNEKDEVFIGLVANNRPKAMFVFKPTEYHSLLNKDGSPVSPAKVSELYALAYADLMEKAVIRILGDEFIGHEEIKARKEAAKAARGGGGGGYRGGQNGGGGGYQKPNNYQKGGGYQKPAAAAPVTDFTPDDEFPF